MGWMNDVKVQLSTSMLYWKSRARSVTAHLFRNCNPQHSIISCPSTRVVVVVYYCAQQYVFPLSPFCCCWVLPLIWCLCFFAHLYTKCLDLCVLWNKKLHEGKLCILQITQSSLFLLHLVKAKRIVGVK